MRGNWAFHDNICVQGEITVLNALNTIINQHDISFESESGGRTRNAHYQTNNHLIESQDVSNKGASSETINLDSIPMNERGDNSGRLVEG